MTRAALALALLLGVAARAEDGSPFLHVLPVEDASGGAARVRAVLELHAARAALPDELTRRKVARRDGARLVVAALGAYPADRARALPRHTKASWVLDYDEPPVREVSAALAAELGKARPTPEALARFTSAFVKDKNYGRGWDIASQVARRRAGDCTEHAVLLAALARAAHVPARVATGLVLVREQGRTYAFGHAWAELRTRDGWVPADGALPPELERTYLPISILDAEGPDYAIGMMGQLTVADVARVRLEPATP